jgi:hypothetical protein
MPSQLFSTACAAGATTATFDFGSEMYERAYFCRGTMTTAAQFSVYGSQDGTNYFKVMHPPIATATTTLISFVVSSAITSCMVPIPIVSRYMKFEASAAAVGAVSMMVVTHRNP